MVENKSPKSKQGKSKSPRKIIGIIAAVVVVAVVLGVILLKSEEATQETMATFDVQRGSLTISVLEAGTIKARDQIIIKNEVEGRTSIITLIPEGTIVKQGDLLVELDASSLEDSKIDQEIRVQNAEASFINSSENLAVVKNQAQSDIDKAELTLKFAEQDLKQYQEGEYPNQLSEAESKIILAQEELTRAEKTLEWSETLYKEKYISETEYEADRLARQRKALDLKLAQNDLELLKNFTYQRQMAQLESDVHQATMALERTTRKAKADVVQAEAELKAKEAEYKRQQDKLDKIEDQILKTKIFAPAEGLVIYATSARSGGFRGNVEPLDEGQEVRERQELIYLPTTQSSLAELNIHESSLEKVRLGLPTIITIDALPGKKFLGRVAKIAPLPDAQSMWMNPDLKVYNTEVYLDNSDSSLRTGMSCQAEIIIEQYTDAVYIPVQAVLRVKGEPTVFVVEGKNVVQRTVELGLDNNRMIRIVSGLKEGEMVLLTPPLEAGTVDASVKESAFAPNSDTNVDGDLKQKIDDSLKSVNGKEEEQLQPSPENGDRQPGQQRKPRQEGQTEGDSGSREKRRSRGAMGNLSPEQREAMRKKLEAMSPEDRQKEIDKLRKQFQNSSSESAPEAPPAAPADETGKGN